MNFLVLGAEIDADNFGVHLIAEGVIEMIDRSFLGQNNIVFGDTVLNTDNKFSAQRKLRLLIQKADVVVYINGGDGFTDNYGARRFIRILLPVLYGKFKGKVQVFAPQTIGPFRKAHMRILEKISINSVDLIFARDKESYFRAFKISPQKTFLSIDLSFFRNWKPMNRERAPGQVALNVSGLLWVPNNYVDNIEYQKLIIHIIEFCNSIQLKVVVIPHVIGKNKTDSDLVVIKDLSALYEDSITFCIPSNIQEVSDILEISTLAIGSRLHFCLHAAHRNLPFLALAYSPKFAGIISEIPLGRTVDINLNKECLSKTLKFIEDNMAVGQSDGVSISHTYFNQQSLIEDSLARFQSLI